MLDQRQLEPALTEQEMLLRDHFVCEYLRDFDAYKACLRLGFQATYAIQWSRTLYEDGYVQRKIAHMTKVPDAEAQAADRALVELTLRTVMRRGSDSARVAAARELNAMHGWSKPDGSDAGDEDLVESFKRVAQQLPS